MKRKYYFEQTTYYINQCVDFQNSCASRVHIVFIMYINYLLEARRMCKYSM